MGADGDVEGVGVRDGQAIGFLGVVHGELGALDVPVVAVVDHPADGEVVGAQSGDRDLLGVCRGGLEHQWRLQCLPRQARRDAHCGDVAVAVHVGPRREQHTPAYGGVDADDRASRGRQGFHGGLGSAVPVELARRNGPGGCVAPDEEIADASARQPPRAPVGGHDVLDRAQVRVVVAEIPGVDSPGSELFLTPDDQEFVAGGERAADLVHYNVRHGGLDVRDALESSAAQDARRLDCVALGDPGHQEPVAIGAGGRLRVGAADLDRDAASVQHRSRSVDPRGVDVAARARVEPTDEVIRPVEGHRGVRLRVRGAVDDRGCRLVHPRNVGVEVEDAAVVVVPRVADRVVDGHHRRADLVAGSVGDGEGEDEGPIVEQALGDDVAALAVRNAFVRDSEAEGRHQHIRVELVACGRVDVGGCSRGRQAVIGDVGGGGAHVVVRAALRVPHGPAHRGPSVRVATDSRPPRVVCGRDRAHAARQGRPHHALALDAGGAVIAPGDDGAPRCPGDVGCALVTGGVGHVCRSGRDRARSADRRQEDVLAVAIGRKHHMEPGPVRPGADGANARGRVRDDHIRLCAGVRLGQRCAADPRPLAAIVCPGDKPGAGRVRHGGPRVAVVPRRDGQRTAGGDGATLRNDHAVDAVSTLVGRRPLLDPGDEYLGGQHHAPRVVTGRHRPDRGLGPGAARVDRVVRARLANPGGVDDDRERGRVEPFRGDADTRGRPVELVSKIERPACRVDDGDGRDVHAQLVAPMQPGLRDTGRRVSQEGATDHKVPPARFGQCPRLLDPTLAGLPGLNHAAVVVVDPVLGP